MWGFYNTHFVDLDDDGKVMILGCHDLSIYNPRSKSAKGWRKKVNKEIKELATKFKPKFVLQHPHTAVKKRTWYNAWYHLKRALPSVQQYAGAGVYYEPNRKKSKWDPLNDVLESTKYGSTLDFIVRKGR